MRKGWLRQDRGSADGTNEYLVQSSIFHYLFKSHLALARLFFHLLLSVQDRLCLQKTMERVSAFFHNLAHFIWTKLIGTRIR